MLLLLLSLCRTNRKKQVQLAVTSWGCLGQKAKSNMPMNLIPLLFTSNDFRKVEPSTVCVNIYACTYIYVYFKSCIPDRLHEPGLGYVSQLVFIIRQVYACRRAESCSLIRVFWNAGTYHWSQNREKEGSSGHIAGALSESGNKETQQESNSWMRDVLQRSQFAT